MEGFPSLCDYSIAYLERLVKGFRKLFFSPYCGNVTFSRHPVCYSCTADEKHRLAQTARPLRVLSVSVLLRNKWLTSSTHRSVHPSAFLGYRPLTVFIVSQVWRLVNTFFEISSTFFEEGSWLCSVHPWRSANLGKLCHPRHLWSTICIAEKWDALNPFGVKSGDFTGLTRIFAVYCRPTCGE